MITVIGLGQERGDLTLFASCELLSKKKLLLRTQRHPVTAFLLDQQIEYEALDFLYEESVDFNELNHRIAGYVTANDPCVYGVPGGGGLFDESVRAVCDMARLQGIEVQIVPGVGQLESAAAMAGGASGAIALPAQDFQTAHANPRLPLVLVEIHSRVLASELKLKLLDVYPADFSCRFCGSPIALEELDRQAAYDHLSSICIPPMELMRAERYDLTHLMEVIERLRAPDGCPWDREQTHQSLKADLIEECYEALDAIDRDDMDMLCDELGDVLLHVAMHSEIADEHGEFGIGDVTSAICKKMIRRHPHVFGETVVHSTQEVLENWNAIKQEEKKLSTYASTMSDVPKGFPALLRAEKVQKRAKAFGFDFADFDEAFEKVLEEVQEVRNADGDELKKELGDLLFAVVNTCRFAGISPEIALNGCVNTFIGRVDAMERLALQEGLDLKCMSLAEMDILWVQIKKDLARK